RRLLLPLLLCLLASPSSAADPTYWGEVRQALRKNCTVCHNKRNLAEPEVSGGLTLDTYAAALKWKDRALVVPGNSRDSLLHQVVVTAATEKRMPLGANPLTPETIDLFRRWIDSGAKEGTRPPDEGTIVATPPKRLRKLDVLLPTTTIPTALPGSTKAP